MEIERWLGGVDTYFPCFLIILPKIEPFNASCATMISTSLHQKGTSSLLHVPCVGTEWRKHSSNVISCVLVYMSLE